MDIKKIQENMKELKEHIKLNEDFIQEDLDEIKRLERKSEIVGLKPIEIEKIGKLQGWIEEKRKVIKDLKKDLQGYEKILKSANKDNNQNNSEDEADL